MRKGVAVFSIMTGLLMLGTWSVLFLLNQFPQIRTLPIETGYLLVAEFLTSVALVASGYGVLSHRSWGMPLLLVALGELMYCAIRFAGELGQAGTAAGLAFFSLVGVLATTFAIYLIVSTSRQSSFLDRQA